MSAWGLTTHKLYPSIAMVKNIGIGIVAIALLAILMLNGFIGFQGERAVSQSVELQEGESITLDDRVEITLIDIETNPDTVELSLNELDTNGYQKVTLNETETGTVALTGGDVTLTAVDIYSSAGGEFVVIETNWDSPWGISENTSKVGSLIPILVLGVLFVAFGRACDMF